MEIGSKLGHYEILAPLGEGGMGQVYRARDTTLDRDVAIKVLPEDFATDAGRLAQFEREAKLLASLNHPNIAMIFGFEKSDGVRFIAMELVEGQSLAERIEASGRIEVDEALEIARRIALALEAAHEAGVIHRDLKPANVQVAPDGTVKVLDFGLAKAYEAEGSEPSSDLSHSPTIMAATGTGVIMGTAPYMSPEQARGQPVDKRADIWAFGCVLYEMLTGERTFDGKTVSDTMASILRDEPNWDRFAGDVPSRIRDLLRRCLVKLPCDRLRDIGDARIEIIDAVAQPDVTTARSSAPAKRWPVPSWGLAALVVVGTLAVLYGLRSEAPSRRPTQRTLVDLGQLGRVRTGISAHPALSPDGTRLVYAAEVDGTTRLYTRSLDRLETEPIAGTEGAYAPFFSPDGEWVGFFSSVADRRLRKVSVRGGQPQPLCDACEAPIGGGASWGADDVVVFSAQVADQWRLFRVSLAENGDPEILTSVDRDQGERAHLALQILPGGDSALLTIRGSLGVSWSRVGVVDLETGNPALEHPRIQRTVRSDGTRRFSSRRRAVGSAVRPRTAAGRPGGACSRGD